MSAVPVTLDATEAPALDTAMSSVADSHPTHAAHPDALRLRAVSLWCEGLRSPAIARQLDIPERTIRSWLDSARAAFQAEQGETAQEIIALAVERQLAIAAAAWQSYHHAEELEQLALDYYHAGLNRAATLKNIDDELPPPPPRPSTAPARYLSVALAAQREAARLAGCYDLAKAMAARTAQPAPPTYAQTRGLDPADECAWDGFLRQMGLSPARFAGPADLDALYCPAWEAVRRKLRTLQAYSATVATPRAPSPAMASPIPAETATAPTAPMAPDTITPIPAETATAPAPALHPVAAGSPFPPRREGGQGVRSEPEFGEVRTRISGRNGNRDSGSPFPRAGAGRATGSEQKRAERPQSGAAG